MSTTRSPPGDDEHAEIDPHGIVPDSFCEDYSADSIAAALRIAEALPAGEYHDEPRCPSCLSTAIKTKGDVQMQHKIDSEFLCHECSTHFDDPAPSRIEALQQEAAQASERERPKTKERFENSEQGALDEIAE